jgi:hypothetical protein
MVAWGDVPTWMTAGVAFLALIGAVLAYRTQSEQLRLQRIQLADQTRIHARAVARTLLTSGYRFERGRTVPPGAMAFICATTLGSVRACLACARPAERHDRTPMTGSQLAGAAPGPAAPLLTCDVPAVDFSCASRDSTDDGERSKRPVTCTVLTPPPVSQVPTPRTAEPAGSSGVGAGTRVMITRIYVGTNRAQRVLMARQFQYPARSG